MVGVKDQVDAAARGVKRCLAAPGMRHRLFAQSMDLADHDFGLFLGEGGDELAIVAPLDAIKRNLDAIDAVLYLAADLLHRFGGSGDKLADRGFRRADPGRVPVGQTLCVVRYRPAAMTRGPSNRLARFLADRQADLPRIPRRADRGKPGRGHLLSKEETTQCAEFERAIKVDILLLLALP